MRSTSGAGATWAEAALILAGEPPLGSDERVPPSETRRLVLASCSYACLPQYPTVLVDPEAIGPRAERVDTRL